MFNEEELLSIEDCITYVFQEGDVSSEEVKLLEEVLDRIDACLRP